MLIFRWILFFELIQCACNNKHNKRKGQMPKKTSRKPVAKRAQIKSAPVMEHRCECGENCHCHCHGMAHWIKHLIVWAIIFALGMVAGKTMNCGHHKQMPKINPVFENGCLKMDSIRCPKMLEKLANADADGNNCISLQEYKVIKKEMRKDMRKDMPGYRGMHFGHGPRAPKPETTK